MTGRPEVPAAKYALKHHLAVASVVIASLKESATVAESGRLTEFFHALLNILGLTSFVEDLGASYTWVYERIPGGFVTKLSVQKDGNNLFSYVPGNITKEIIAGYGDRIQSVLNEGKAD